MRTTELPSPKDYREYLRQTRAKMEAWLDAWSDNEIPGEPSGHPWCGQHRFELALYIPRRTMHHHGEIHAFAVLVVCTSLLMETR
jgi:hypothetical protein